MKKYLSLFLILFALCFPVFADEGETLECTDAKCPGPSYELAMSPVFLGCGKAGVAPAAYCTSCTGTSDADIFCEDFEGVLECDSDGNPDEADACRCQYTVSESEGTFTFNAAHSGTFACTDKGNYALQFDKTTESGFPYARKSWTDTPSIYTSFYVNVVTGLDEDDSKTIAAINGDLNNVFLLRLKRSDGTNHYFNFAYHNGTDFTYTSDYTITTGTWYRIRIRWSQSTDNNGIAQAYINNDEQVNISNNASTRDTDQFVFGGVGSGTIAFVVQYDNLKIDDDTMPAACSQ